MAVHLNLRGAGILFPGDLEAAGWKALLQALPEFRTAVKDTKVLVASHHGRESNICADLFDDYACRPPDCGHFG
jgi:beta-lactamase superfamily II metal-dependent hydrolase